VTRTPFRRCGQATLVQSNRARAIDFFNNYVRTAFEDFLGAKMPLCLNDVGGSLYIRKIAAD
jgi:hypothetical protein